MCDPLGVCTRRHGFFFTSTSEEPISLSSTAETGHESRNAESASEFGAPQASQPKDGADNASECNETRKTKDVPDEHLDENILSRMTAFTPSPIELKRCRSCPALVERARFNLKIAELSGNSLNRKPSRSSVSTAFFSAQSRQPSLDEGSRRDADQPNEDTDVEEEYTECYEMATERQLFDGPGNDPWQCEKGILQEGITQETSLISGHLASASLQSNFAQTSPRHSLKRSRSISCEEASYCVAPTGKKQRASRFRRTIHAQDNREGNTGITVASDVTSPSTFRTADWERVDKSAFNYDPAKAVFANSKGTAASSLTRLIHPQAYHAQLQNDVSPELGSGSIQNDTEPPEPGAVMRSIVPLGQHKDALMEDTGSFVSAISKFNEIIPGCDAIQRFKDMPTRCLANKLDGSRCRSNIPSGPSSEIESLLLDLENLNFSENIPRGINALAKLAHLAICRFQRHHVWRSLYSLLPISQGSPLAVPRSTLSNTTAETRNGYLRLRSSPFEEDVATKLPDTTATDWLKDLRAQVPQHLPVYLSYHSPESKPRNINDLLREEAMKPLDTFHGSERFSGLDERRSGYIYVYWNRASFGLMKIGCTTRDVGLRIREWEEQCHHIADEQYRSREPINNAAKVEKLLHLEFRQHRVLEPICHGCGRSHIEWFQGLDLRNVIARIEAWTQWISQEPYENGGNYNLKAAMRDSIPLVGIGMDAGSDTPRSTPVSPRRPSRYDLRRRSTARTINFMQI